MILHLTGYFKISFEDESDNQDFDHIDSDQSGRSKFVAVSCHDDRMSIHINAIKLKECEEDDEHFENSTQIYQDDSQVIFDVSKMTRNLTAREIKQTILNYLTPDNHISNLYLDSIENLKQTKVDNKFIYLEDDKNSFELENRVKFEKLTKEQISFLKEVLLQSDLSKKQIQSKYNVSYSVLNRIEKCSIAKIYNSKSRNIVKMSKIN